MYAPTTYTQYDGVAVYGSTNSDTGSFTSLTLTVFGSVAANSSQMLGPTTVDVPVGATNLRVGVFSVYGSQMSSTVSLTLNSTAASNLNGTAFSTDFSGFNEATIASDILTNRQWQLDGRRRRRPRTWNLFFNTYNSDFPLVDTMTNTASGTIVTFSNAAAGGSASLDLTHLCPSRPPGRCWASAAGLLGLTLRRRARPPRVKRPRRSLRSFP